MLKPSMPIKSACPFLMNNIHKVLLWSKGCLEWTVVPEVMSWTEIEIYWFGLKLWLTWQRALILIKYQLLVIAGTVTLNKTAALRPPTLSSTQNMSHYWEFLYLDLITFHLMYYLGDAISHIHLSVSLILCLCISLTLSFLYNTHTNTHTVLSASPQPLYKRSLFKGSMSGRIGPGSLPEAYQWRKSTLMLLL